MADGEIEPSTIRVVSASDLGRPRLFSDFSAELLPLPEWCFQLLLLLPWEVVGVPARDLATTTSGELHVDGGLVSVSWPDIGQYPPPLGH